ncbi:hypothetical protein ACN2XU_14445 [Primorskyibacter sp. 2E107]|uniref:hypothetical protein n=1 Tax=Primorskyibacter sp. 2E107 TaxID=3403458 RepID=UPI003AF61A5E
MTPSAISRRTLLAALPASGVALALPSATKADAAILDVIHELENWQTWEMSSIIAAKAYAAYRMREALGMALPDPKYARRHLDFQGQSFLDYKGTVGFERDRAGGKIMTPPRPASDLASG